MKRTMTLLCSLILSIGSSKYFAIAQVRETNNSTRISIYNDLTNGFSFYFPTWFSVRKDTEYLNVMDVMESNELSFKFEIIDILVNNDEYRQHIGADVQDSNDLFLRAVKEATFFSGAVNHHGLVQYARLDSLKEFKSHTGLRVIATYRTIVSVDGIPIDNEHLGPLYFIDISELSKGKLLKFDFSWYDMTKGTYDKLALSIALSVSPK